MIALNLSDNDLTLTNPYLDKSLTRKVNRLLPNQIVNCEIHQNLTISTRRFLPRPTSSSLEATGAAIPIPTATMRLDGIW